MKCAGDAAVQVLEEIVIVSGRAVFTLVGVSLEPVQVEGRRKALFQRTDVLLEAFQKNGELAGLGVRLAVIVEEQLYGLAFRKKRREPGHGEHEIALVHDAPLFKETATFLIHGGGNEIGEVATAPFRITGSFMAHVVDMDHPAVVQRQQGAIQQCSSLVPFGFRLLGVILAGIEPSRHESPRFAGNHPVIDHCRIVEQIGDAGFL